MSMNQILINWATPGGGAVSVMNFNDATASVVAQRNALAAWLGDLDGFLSEQVTYQIATSGRVLEPEDGSISGLWSDATAHTGVGATAGQPVADASQALVRWQTDSISPSGRVVQGRTFIPGLAVSHLFNGNISSAASGPIGLASAELADLGVGLSVWHRPTGSPASGGALYEVIGGSCWAELAVQRGRRG